MQWVFFENRYNWYIRRTMGSGAKPQESEKFSRISVSEVTLHSVRLPLTVSYRKKIEGAGCITCSQNNFDGGAAAPLTPAGSRTYGHQGWKKTRFFGKSLKVFLGFF